MIDRMCLAFGLCVVPLAVSADAWDMFVARCLDPYEHLSPEVIGGLSKQPADPMHDAKQVFGPSDEGYLLILDAAPDLGERSCSVEALGEDTHRAKAWIAGQLAEGRYVTGADGWILSTEWIEPRIMVRAEVDAVRSSYAVVESDFES